MTVYYGLRLQVYLRETDLLPFFLNYNVSGFAILRNGVGSWKSLEGFHSNYLQPVGGVY